MSTSTPSDALSTYEQEVERNYRHNFLVNSLDGATYWFGYSFIAPTIILPLYISHFTSNPLIIGLIPFINTAGVLLPQLFTSNFVERAPVKKFFPVTIGFFTERVPVFLMTASIALFALKNPTVALISFLLLYLWYCAGAGLIIVGWQDMVAKIIPVERRGRFFGITNFAGNASGILGALAVPFVLQRFAFPQGFLIAFVCASVLIFISWFCISLTREPPLRTSKPHVSQWTYLRTLPAIIRRDANFARYLIFQIIFSLSAMGAGFLVVYSARQWNLPDSQAGGYIIAMQIGQALSNLFFGFLADRKGHKLVLELSALLNVITFALAFVSPGPLWFYPVFFLRGATIAASMVSGIAIVMEFTTPEDRPTYFGLANSIPGAAGSIGPLVGGLLAERAGYPVMFAVSALVGLGAFGVLRWMVREPRHTGPLDLASESGSIGGSTGAP